MTAKPLGQRRFVFLQHWRPSFLKVLDADVFGGHLRRSFGMTLKPFGHIWCFSVIGYCLLLCVVLVGDLLFSDSV